MSEQIVSFQPKLLNETLVCAICFGYLREAQTVKECLHTFCKSCIYKYFTENEDCPRCGKSLLPNPYIAIRPDALIQSLVDKLFPEAVKKDYDEEVAFYKQNNLPLPLHLINNEA